MHHADRLPLGIGRLHVAGIVEAGLLFHRQRVQLCTQQKARAAPFSRTATMPSACVPSSYLPTCAVTVYPSLRSFSNISRRLHLVARQLRIFMKVLVRLGQRGELLCRRVRQVAGASAQPGVQRSARTEGRQRSGAARESPMKNEGKSTRQPTTPTCENSQGTRTPCSYCIPIEVGV